MLRKHPELWDAHWVVTGERGRDFFEICLKDDHGTGHYFVINGANLELAPTQIDPTLISFEHPDDLIMEPGDQEREGLWKKPTSGWWGVARWSR